MDSLNDKSGYYAAILFLVWPALAVISAFKNYPSSWGKNVFWAFTAFYGFVFAIGAESQSSDIVRYVAEFEYLHGMEMSVADAIQYYRESGEIDILRTFLAITISRFTGSQAILTLIYGVIFGYFFSRNLWFIFERLEGKMKSITILLLVCCFLVLPIWNINGFRMWTAAHIFIYGALLFLFDEKKKGLLISASSILVHFSFIIPMGALLVYLVMGNRVLSYFIFFVITFFVAEIDLNAFNKIVESYAPEILQERTEGYRNEAYVEMHRENTNSETVWYVVWHDRALNFSILGFIVLLFFKGRSFFAEHHNWLSLFSFVLLFSGIVNLLTSLPSGGRFFDITSFLALVIIILYIQNRKNDEMIERFAWVATPALVLYVVVAFRIGLYSMSATAVLGNPVIAMFLMGEHISLNDVMKMIL